MPSRTPPGCPTQELRLLNPELRRDATPPGDDAYLLKVPVGTKAKVEQLLDRIPTYKFPPLAKSAICVGRLFPVVQGPHGRYAGEGLPPVSHSAEDPQDEK